MGAVERPPTGSSYVPEGEGSQWAAEMEAVRFELAALRERVVRLEGMIGTKDASQEAGRWWESVEEG